MVYIELSAKMQDLEYFHLSFEVAKFRVKTFDVRDLPQQNSYSLRILICENCIKNIAKQAII
jgi:hypothetical protein